jgi:hypothetical protein
MSKLCIRVIQLFAILSIGISSSAQEFPDSKGRDFWMSFMPNWHNNENELAADPAMQREHQLYVYIGAERPTKGRVTWRRNDGSTLVDTFQITDVRNIVRLSKFYQNIELRGITPSGTGNLNYTNSQNETVALQSVHVEAEDDVTVYALNQATLTSEAFMVLPTDALSDDYMVVAYNSDVRMSGNVPGPNTTPSQFVVVASEDSTIVDITPSVGTVKNRTRETVSIRLDQGESYLVQADPRMGFLTDLTGSIVRASKPVAVFGGQQRAIVPIAQVDNLGSRDCLIEQMTPIRTWGKSAYITPFARSSNEVNIGTDLYRVVAAFDSTEVFVDGNLAQMLMRGQYMERPLVQAHVITTSNPTSTVQYKKTAGIGGGTDITRRGDPAMMLVPPAEQFMNQYRFISIQAYIFDFVGGRIQPVDSVYLEQWLNVVIPTVSLGSLVLDGVPIDQTKFLPIGNSAYSWAKLPMRDGVHEIKADTNFGIYVYGYGDANSYGYIGGMSFRPLDVYPPKLIGKVRCYEFDGVMTDSVLGDSRLQTYSVVSTPEMNTTYTVGSFTPPQPTLPIRISLKNRFLDGSAIVEIKDFVEQKSQFTIDIPGFTVAPVTHRDDTSKVQTRNYVVPIGRVKCDSVEIENYGKYPQTITNVQMPGTMNLGLPQVPFTLQPGERVKIQFCHTGTEQKIFEGPIRISDSCSERNVLNLIVEERLDRDGPKVLDNRDSCKASYRVSISDEVGSDLGLERARILDSMLVNCRVVMVDSTIIDRTYSVEIIDPYRDAIVGFEAVDSVGNVTRRIDTIPGFAMSINGNYDVVQTHDMGICTIGEVACDTLVLDNIGIRSVVMPSVFVRQNTIFSVPQSQFAITIDPVSGTSSLIVCFSPTVADTVKIVRDTIEFQQYCLVRTLILEGRGKGQKYTGLSRCDVPITAVSRKIGAVVVTPQPATDHAVISFGEPLTSATVQLLDVTGAVVLRQEWAGEKTQALQLDLSNVPAGSYACLVTSATSSIVPLVVVR